MRCLVLVELVELAVMVATVALLQEGLVALVGPLQGRLTLMVATVEMEGMQLQQVVLVVTVEMVETGQL